MQYQSQYVPDVWYSNYQRPPGPYPQPPIAPQEKSPPSKASTISWVMIVLVLSTGVLTAGAIAASVYFATGGFGDTSKVANDTELLDDKATAIEGYDLEIYNNPLDYRAFKAVTENGTITVYGPKDANGVLTVPEVIEYVDLDGNQNTVNLEDNGLIQVINNDNVSIQFTWSPETNSLFAVALKKTGGSLQANVNVQLENVTLNNLTSTSTKRKRSLSDILTRVKRQATTYAKVPISVSQCSDPADGATVYGAAIFDYDEDEPGTVIQVQGQSAGVAGEYEILIPTTGASDATQIVESICSGISGVVGTGCTAVSLINAPAEIQICTALATAIELLTFAVPGDSVLVFAACEAGFRATRVMCIAFDSPVAGPGPSLFDGACSAVTSVVDLAINQAQDVFLKPYARLADGQVLTSIGEVIQVQPGSSTVSASFSLTDDGSTFEVISLEASPSDPDPGETYLVEIYYNCVSQGTVTMDILGTDTYSDEIICDAVNACNCCVLNVPGAAALVVDLVSVQYTNEDGQVVFTRQIVLVF